MTSPTHHHTGWGVASEHTGITQNIEHGVSGFFARGARWRHVSIDVKDVSEHRKKMFADTRQNLAIHKGSGWRAP